MSLVAGGFYYFVADDGSSGIQIWKSDGTTNGTVRVTNQTNFYPHYLVQWGNYIFFSGKDAEGWQWWRFEIGNEAATLTKLTSFNPDNPDEGGFPCYPIIVGDWMYFSAKDATYGRELFRMNQSGYVELLTDIAQGTASSNPNGIPNTNYRLFSILERDGILYFTALDENNYHNIYSYDTQNEQLQQLTYFQIIYSNSVLYPRTFSLSGNKLIFAFNDLQTGAEPWAYDLTWGQPKISLGDEFGNNSNFSVHPNPANDVLYLNAEFPEKIDVKIKITNMLGLEMYSISKSGVSGLTEQINIKHYPAGIYFIETQAGSNKIIRKIIKN